MIGPRRIALIDDHRMFADGFGVMVNSLRSGHQVETFDDPVAFLKQLGEGKRFDLVVLDLVMRSMNGLAVLAAIRERKTGMPVLMLSGIGAEPPVAEMKALGARGFVHKSADADTLIRVIDRILGGGTSFPEGGAGPADADVDENWVDAPDGGVPHLGPRQHEILHLLGGGATNKAIAAQLDISENTVKFHVRAIFDALNAHTRTACVRKAQMLGLI